VSTTQAWLCVRGHPNDEQHDFCTQCGERAVAVEPAAARACEHGHPMIAEHRFCPECGGSAQGIAPAQPQPRRQWALLRDRPARLVTAAALVSALLGLVLVLAGGDGRSEGEDETASTTITAAPLLPTPNQRCALDAWNTAADIINNGDQGLYRELAVGGRENPIFNIGLQIVPIYKQKVYVVGRQQAFLAANAQAESLCQAQDNPNNNGVCCRFG